MNPHIQTMIAWWDGRTRREQILVGAMLALILGLILWYGVIAPIHAWKADAEDRRLAASTDLALVEADLARLNADASGAPVGSGEPIEPLLNRTAEAVSLVIDRQQAEADGAQTVWLTGAAPTALFSWIADLETTHGVTVSNITVLKSAAGSGLDAQASFRSGS